MLTELQPVKPQPSEKATSFQKSAIVYEDHSLAQCQPVADITACDESDITKEEFVPSEEKCTLSLSSTDTRHSKDQIIENSIPETVSGMVSENIEGRISPEGSPISRPLPSQRITNKLGRRSASPESPSAKVVSVLDLPFVDEEGGQRLHPSSALKIYALAKTCRKSCSGKSLLSRPRIKRRSFAKHSEIEESFHANHSLEITDDELRRIMINRSAVPEPRRTKIADERKKPREKKDLVKWCLDALSEKGKRPVFSPKPRLRSRRSAHFDKSHGKAVYGDFVSSVYSVPIRIITLILSFPYPLIILTLSLLLSYLIPTLIILTLTMLSRIILPIIIISLMVVTISLAFSFYPLPSFPLLSLPLLSFAFYLYP